MAPRFQVEGVIERRSGARTAILGLIRIAEWMWCFRRDWVGGWGAKKLHVQSEKKCVEDSQTLAPTVQHGSVSMCSIEFKSRYDSSSKQKNSFIPSS